MRAEGGRVSPHGPRLEPPRAQGGSQLVDGLLDLDDVSPQHSVVVAMLFSLRTTSGIRVRVRVGVTVTVTVRARARVRARMRVRVRL